MSQLDFFAYLEGIGSKEGLSGLLTELVDFGGGGSGFFGGLNFELLEISGAEAIASIEGLKIRLNQLSSPYLSLVFSLTVDARRLMSI